MKDGGISKGPSHKDGGIPFTVKGSSGKFELEGGEGVLSKKTMAIDKEVTVSGTPCEIASELNQMGGGVKFDCEDIQPNPKEFAHGGIINRMFVADHDNGGLMPDGGKRRELPPIEFKEGGENWILNAESKSAIQVSDLIISELFSIYPEIGNISIVVVDLPKYETYDAFFVSKDNAIAINKSSKNYIDHVVEGKDISIRTNRGRPFGSEHAHKWLLSLISHELQHAIQREEGRRAKRVFKPEEPEYDYSWYEVEARESQLREIDRESNPFEGLDKEKLIFEKGGTVPVTDWEMPDSEVLRYGLKLKKDHPEIWDAGGNIRGNESFELLLDVVDRGYWLKSDEEFYKRWQSFKARHQHNHRLPGIVANIKWASWGNIGKEAAKEIIEGSRKYENGGIVTPEDQRKEWVNSFKILYNRIAMEHDGVIDWENSYVASDPENGITQAFGVFYDGREWVADLQNAEIAVTGEPRMFEEGGVVEDGIEERQKEFNRIIRSIKPEEVRNHYHVMIYDGGKPISLRWDIKDGSYIPMFFYPEGNFALTSAMSGPDLTSYQEEELYKNVGLGLVQIELIPTERYKDIFKREVLLSVGSNNNKNETDGNEQTSPFWWELSPQEQAKYNEPENEIKNFIANAKLQKGGHWPMKRRNEDQEYFLDFVFEKGHTVIVRQVHNDDSLGPEIYSKKFISKEDAMRFLAENYFWELRGHRIWEPGEYSTPESFRDSFRNEQGEVINVFAYVNPNNSKEFLVETSKTVPNGDGTSTIKTKKRWIPIEQWDSFVADFKARKEASEHAGTFEKIQHGEIKTPEDLGESIVKEHTKSDKDKSWIKKEYDSWDKIPDEFKKLPNTKVSKYDKRICTDKNFVSLFKPFVSKDQLRRNLTGIYFNDGDVVATDGNIMIVSEAEQSDGTIRSTKDCSVIDGKYPDYKNASFTDISHKYKFSVDKLLLYVNAISKIENDRGDVTFEINNGRKIGFKIDYILNVLNYFKKTNVIEAYIGVRKEKTVDPLLINAIEDYSYNEHIHSVFSKNPDLSESNEYIILMGVQSVKYKGSKYGTQDLDFGIECSVYFSFTDGQIHNGDGSIVNLNNKESTPTKADYIEALEGAEVLYEFQPSEDLLAYIEGLKVMIETL